MPCSAKFLMRLQTEILLMETSDFLKQIFFLKSFNSVLYMIIMISQCFLTKAGMTLGQIILFVKIVNKHIL